ncbi:hypothetical protein NC651_019672 [Populus alba x Populus x berolinensis]|nr:hypothetical protein NC651_019672 [Populus alba x Populus x berolinensis]
MGSETFLEVILAIILPPVGVFLRGVLDMFAVDHTGIYSRDYICPLCISWIVYKSLLVRFAVFTFQGQSCLLLLFYCLVLLRSAVFTSCQIITVCFSMV